VSDEFVQSVRTMHVTSNDPKVSWPLQGHGGIDRVSFDMNMSSHEETEKAIQCKTKTTQVCRQLRDSVNANLVVKQLGSG
jgi:hypothetical protein